MRDREGAQHFSTFTLPTLGTYLTLLDLTLFIALLYIRTVYPHPLQHFLPPLSTQINLSQPTQQRDKSISFSLHLNRNRDRDRNFRTPATQSFELSLHAEIQISASMPSRLAAPVLTVDAAKMHKVDTRNVENLFGMWTGETLNPYLTSIPPAPSCNRNRQS